MTYDYDLELTFNVEDAVTNGEAPVAYDHVTPLQELRKRQGRAVLDTQTDTQTQTRTDTRTN